MVNHLQTSHYPSSSIVHSDVGHRQKPPTSLWIEDGPVKPQALRPQLQWSAKAASLAMPLLSSGARMLLVAWGFHGLRTLRSRPKTPKTEACPAAALEIWARNKWGDMESLAAVR